MLGQNLFMISVQLLFFYSLQIRVGEWKGLRVKTWISCYLV